MPSVHTLKRFDPVPAWKAAVRKTIPLFIVSRRDESPSREAFDAHAGTLQRRATAASDRADKLAAVWRIETLAASLARSLLRESIVSQRPLPTALAPIAHMGFAIPVVEACGFDAIAIQRTLEALCDPQWIGFAYESAGAMLALYERNAFHAAARVLSRFGAVPLVPLDEPNVARFAAAFSADTARLISHGYGRMTYFTRSTAAAAIHAAVRYPFLDRAACTQGVALAHAYVNSRDLPAILATDRHEEEHAAAWRAGQISALAFLEWFAPGSLDGIRPASEGAAGTIAAARHEIAASCARGVLTPFALEDAAREGTFA